MSNKNNTGNDHIPNQNKQNCINVESVIPRHRQDLLKWNGWGYIDSRFAYTEDSAYFTGKRYPIGESNLPHVLAWAYEQFNVKLTNPKLSQNQPTHDQLPKPQITPDLYEKIKNLNVNHSINGIDRLIRCHGQTLHDIYTLRYSKFQRIPDIVLWPTNHDDVVKIVNFAHTNNLVIIPYGGGTAVSGAVQCPANEQRTIISLDTSQMNRILWIDYDNLTACCESGIIGQDLERELKKLGYTTGHEPDSYEFSSLGGWVATRASGMKKNVYGNIEDILVHAKLVTPQGVLTKNCQVPRMSCGPDFNHIIMGSEGTFGVITDVIIKIRPLPKCKRFGSMIFPDFDAGFKCMHQVAKQRCQPASIRLMDNGQFKMSIVLKAEQNYYNSIMDGFKRFYITKIKGFNVDKMCAMTLLFEGDDSDVDVQEKKIYEIGGRFGGLPAGETNGERGYMLTFIIAYVRDLALEHRVVAESFETSVPWDRALTLCNNVKRCVAVECKNLGIKYFMINCRVTQTYDTGCVIYFYLAFNHYDIDNVDKENPVELHHILEEKARDEIIACGGSISHHHGVGKLRTKWYPNAVSQIGVDLFLATKKQLDPRNIFATNNLIKAKL